MTMLVVLSISSSYFSLMGFRIYLRSFDIIKIEDNVLSYGAIFRRKIELKRVKFLNLKELNNNYIELDFKLKKKDIKIGIELKNYKNDNEYNEMISYFNKNIKVNNVEYVAKEE
jgi:hypothetical protein